MNFICLMCTGIYAWPLILKVPKTIWILFEAFRPGGYGIANDDFWAFSRVDAAFRPWYSKIAKDYHSQGRFGYVWDDGLGMPLGARIYNNLGTYRLLHWLGHRQMMAGGYALMVLATIILVSLHFGFLIGSLFGLLTAGSPLIVIAYTHYGKPEMFWWPFIIPVIYLGLFGHGLWAGLAWSCLAMLNLSVSYMIILLMGPTFLATLYFNSALLGGIAGCVPGIGKNVIRLIYMWRTGFMSSLSSEQARLWKRPLRPTLNELIHWVPFVVSISLSMCKSAMPVLGLLIIVFCIGIYWFNYRIMYLNDPQSFHISFWLIALIFACLNHSFYALLATIPALYLNPIFYGLPVSDTSTSNDMDIIDRWRYLTRECFFTYPALVPSSAPRPDALMTFFGMIPNGARLIAESDGDPRSGSRFRVFWQWTEEFLPARQIDLANEMYTRALEPELVDKYLTSFNAQHMMATEMSQICLFLGVSHVVTHTEETFAMLRRAGYQSIAEVDLAPLDEFRAIIFNLPQVKLHLVEINRSATIIEPVVSWSRSENELKWVATAGKSYIIKYRYNEQFQALQNGKKLAVSPHKLFGDLPLKFMHVTAVMDGPVLLTFHPRCF
jgi:hypothetical protein